MFKWLIKKLENEEAFNKNEILFLPAELEIQESPPNPIAHWLTWIIIIILLLTITWTILGKIDILARADGKLIPQGRVKTVQPAVNGVVKIIHVQEGQLVGKGEPLISLDSQSVDIELNQLHIQLDYTQSQWSVVDGLSSLLQPISYLDTNQLNDTQIKYLNNDASSLLPSNSTTTANISQLISEQWDQFRYQLLVLVNQQESNEVD